MKLTVTKVDDQGDRVLIYGHPKWEDYHIIAPAGTVVNVGDVVEYESEGWNFGWFVKVVEIFEHLDDNGVFDEMTNYVSNIIIPNYGKPK